MSMSYGTFLNFCLAINQQQRQHYQLIAQAVRIGHHADAQMWAKYIES